MVDEPIRWACEEFGVTYSTWIDDLAFSGERARELINIVVDTLRTYGLRVSRTKIKIMGASAAKLITGTRLGAHGVRAPREKLSRIRSGIFKFERGLVSDSAVDRYLKGLVAQLRFVHQLCPKDALRYAESLRRYQPLNFINDSQISISRPSVS
jgi:hypothetical protein